jgi:hypothetical protein
VQFERKSTQGIMSPQCSSLVLSSGSSIQSTASITGCEANAIAACSPHRESANVVGGGKSHITAPSLPPSVAERVRIAARKVARVLAVRQTQSAQVRIDLEAKHAVKGWDKQDPDF